MSSKAYEWSLTHELKSPSQYQLLHFLGITADDEGYFSDREGIKGIDFITYVTGQSKSTIMRSLREFEEANLLHRERRYAAEFGAHPTNTIVLHLWNTGTKQPWFSSRDLYLMHKTSQARFGVTEESPSGTESVTVTPPVAPQGVTVTPPGKTPSEPQGVTLTPPATAPRSHSDTSGSQNSVLPSGVEGVTVTPGSHPDTSTRARALKGNLLTDNQSISQSVTSSAGAREKMTDGLTEANQALKNHPAQPIGAMPAEVAQLQLRTAINRSNPGLLDAVDGPTLDAIMRLLVSREERRGKQVQNPVGFCIRAIGNEPGGIEALTALATIERYTAQETQPATAPAPLPSVPVAFCQVHTREYTGHCPLCIKEATGALTTISPETPADVEAGKALRDQLRARRQAKKEVA